MVETEPAARPGPPVHRSRCPFRCGSARSHVDSPSESSCPGPYPVRCRPPTRRLDGRRAADLDNLLREARTDELLGARRAMRRRRRVRAGAPVLPRRGRAPQRADRGGDRGPLPRARGSTPTTSSRSPTSVSSRPRRATAREGMQMMNVYLDLKLELSNIISLTNDDMPITSKKAIEQSFHLSKDNIMILSGLNQRKLKKRIKYSSFKIFLLRVGCLNMNLINQLYQI